jgi:hypothetical protein
VSVPNFTCLLTVRIFRVPAPSTAVDDLELSRAKVLTAAALLLSARPS